ncbi:hypothetical protein BDV96DRAFT_573084 [Lophiotrema nucula]|uniref:Uncharacterized protein n=1 Tax=Lophiotrema nucula TaxID=690887 RepID=A0A6A5ZBN2_9PLEO|nr:hypothetical protein BDV96DRAFT_573084 [Lophiotrema nucula]
MVSRVYAQLADQYPINPSLLADQYSAASHYSSYGRSVLFSKPRPTLHHSLPRAYAVRSGTQDVTLSNESSIPNGMPLSKSNRYAVQPESSNKPLSLRPVNPPTSNPLQQEDTSPLRLPHNSLTRSRIHTYAVRSPYRVEQNQAGLPTQSSSNLQRSCLITGTN